MFYFIVFIYNLPKGSVAVAGSAIKWLRDSLGIIKKASDMGIYSFIFLCLVGYDIYLFIKKFKVHLPFSTDTLLLISLLLSAILLIYFLLLIY
jgi:hypothetical protein